MKISVYSILCVQPDSCAIQGSIEEMPIWNVVRHVTESREDSGNSYSETLHSGLTLAQAEKILVAIQSEPSSSSFEIKGMWENSSALKPS
jgi:hypothetical protein